MVNIYIEEGRMDGWMDEWMDKGKSNCSLNIVVFLFTVD